MSNVVLSRLLFPEAFGLMALVRLVITGLQLVSDVGIQVNIIQHPRGQERAFLDTAWTLQVLRGCVLWLLGAAVAIPVARYYEQDALAFIVPVAALAVLIRGFESTKVASQQRNVQVGRVVLMDLASQLIALVAMIAIAWIYRSVWALVAGALVTATARTAISHFAFAGERNRFAWERETVADIVRFGLWILLSTLLTFLAQKVDVLLLGKLISLEELGVYSIAVLFAMLPRRIADPLASQVLLPVLSEIKRKGEQHLAGGFRRARAAVLPGGLLLVLATGLGAPAFIYFVYDPRYHAAGEVVQLLMAMIWFSYLHVTADRALVALGDARALATANIVKLATTAVGSIVGNELGGLAGFILGLGFGALCGYGAAAAALARHGLSCWSIDLRYTILGAALTAAALLPVQLLTDDADPARTMMFSILASALVLAPFLVWSTRRVLAAVQARA